MAALKNISNCWDICRIYHRGVNKKFSIGKHGGNQTISCCKTIHFSRKIKIFKLLFTNIGRIS